MTRLFFAIFLFALITLPSEIYASDFSNRFTPVAKLRNMPSFTFQDDQGHTLDLHGFKGQYILLNLWATWCGPCVREMAGLDALQQKIDGKKLRILALTEDHEGISAALLFYKRHDLHHLPVLADTNGEVPSILHINGLPTTLLIDPNGREIGRIEGDADWDDDDTIAFLNKQMGRSLAQAK